MNELSEALRFLPHGPEFRFVDRLLSLHPGQHGTAEYVVRGDEPFLRGHFPDHPLFPGVLLIEAAAQLAGVVAQSDPHIPPMPGLKLTAVRNAKIFGTAAPRDLIVIEATLLARLGNLVQARAVVAVRAQDGTPELSGTEALGRTVLEAELTLSGELRQ